MLRVAAYKPTVVIKMSVTSQTAVDHYLILISTSFNSFTFLMGRSQYSYTYIYKLHFTASDLVYESKFSA